jgi:hypothetical protein
MQNQLATRLDVYLEKLNISKNDLIYFDEDQIDRVQIRRNGDWINKWRLLVTLVQKTNDDYIFYICTSLNIYEGDFIYYNPDTKFDIETRSLSDLKSKVASYSTDTFNDLDDLYQTCKQLFAFNGLNRRINYIRFQLYVDDINAMMRAFINALHIMAHDVEEITEETPVWIKEWDDWLFSVAHDFHL